jgi:3-isopropylmalate/(R)-2-methylmalate dehydratase small subunit
MAQDRIRRVAGRAVPVPGDDIDTDRILSARFMRCVSFDGLGAHLFHDLRFAEDGSPRPCSLNQPRFAGATVMLSNANFGCGSSREHAPQALAGSGFRAVVAEGLAEIFAGKATALGIPCACVSHQAAMVLAELVEREPGTQVVVDLKTQEVTAGVHRFSIWMKPGAREALVSGQWDPIFQLLDGAAETARVTAGLPYLRFSAPSI